MLSEKIESQLLAARKNNDTVVKETLTLLKASLQNKAIELQHDLSDDDVVKVIKSNVKQLNQTLESAKKSGRQELIDKTNAQLNLLSDYLPNVLSKKEIIAQLSTDDTFSTDMPFGKAMGLLMKKFGDQVDGKTASTALKSYLG